MLGPTPLILHVRLLIFADLPLWANFSACQPHVTLLRWIIIPTSQIRKETLKMETTDTSPLG